MGFENSAGLGNRNHYGPREINERFGGEQSTSGGEVTLEAVVDLADVITGAPATSNALMNPGGGTEMEAIIPAYAHVLSAEVEVVEALSTTGGTAATAASLQLGLDRADTGAAIDADGLVDATDGDLTIASNDIAQAIGTRLRGNSAALIANYQADGADTGVHDVTQTEQVSIGANAGQLYAALVIDDVTNMTAVAGKVRICVKYRLPKRDATGNYTAGGVKGDGS